MTASSSPPSSSFFPFIPTLPGPEELDEPALWLSPAWSGPPWHGRPVPIGLSVELGRSDSTVVLIEGARVYREGVVLRFVVRVRETAREPRRRLFAQLDFTSGRGMLNMGLVPGGLRWGFEFSDGQRVTSLDPGPWASRSDGTDPRTVPPDSPVLLGASRPTSWATSWSRDLWLWPLPRPGPLRCVCLWPDRGIEETSTTVDTEEIRHAATRAAQSWFDPT